jgi:hypothetical protein
LPTGGDFGYPTKGCIARSRANLYGSLTTWAQLEALPQVINLDVVSRVTSDSAYLSGLKMWSSCMAGKGYQYSHPSDAVDDISGRYRTSGPTQRMHQLEIATAVADGECADRAQLRSIVATVQAKYTSQLSADQDRTLLTLAEFRATAVARAKRLIVSLSSPTSNVP